MDRLSEGERIEIPMMIGYGDRRRTHDEVRDLFNTAHRHRDPIIRSTVSRTLKKFTESGSVKDRPKSGRPRSVTNEENSLVIILDVVEQPQTSVQQLALNHNMSRRSIQTI